MTDERANVAEGVVLGPVLREELGHVSRHWWWYTILGTAMIVLGTAAIVFALTATIVAVTVFGILLVVAGIAQLVMAFWAGKWSGALIDILIGLLYLIVGFLLAGAPAENAPLLTFVLAILFLVGGTFRVIASLMYRHPNWGWGLFAGVAGILLGIFIILGWPATGLYVIGLFIGIELIFNGWAWLMLSVSLRGVREA